MNISEAIKIMNISRRRYQHTRTHKSKPNPKVQSSEQMPCLHGFRKKARFANAASTSRRAGGRPLALPIAAPTPDKNSSTLIPRSHPDQPRPRLASTPATPGPSRRPFLSQRQSWRGRHCPSRATAGTPSVGQSPVPVEGRK